MKKPLLYIFIFALLHILFTGCSTKKNTMVTRAYHNLTAHYNLHFNANESFKAGLKRIDDQFKDNYTDIFPVFKYDKPEDVSPASGDMDIATKKSAKLITQHSITTRPKRNEDKEITKKEEEFFNKPDFCNWVDDSYLLMGKSHFYKRDFDIGMKSFFLLINRFKNSVVKYDALIWISRTYIQQSKFRDADEYLQMVETDSKHPSNLNTEINLVYADLFLKQKKYAEAIPRLEKAVNKVKKKKEKVRYKFLLAQLYQKTGKLELASKQYREIIKMNPPYEMIFNAQINQAFSFDTKSKNGESLSNHLKKMLKEDKNFDYLDQIYYALANICYKENRLDEAVEYYKESARTSVSNKNQKAMSFLALADIYFSKPAYQLAGAYYDSTMQNLDKKYSKYEEISAKTANLTELVNNLKIVSREDSLQKVAKLSPADQLALVDNIIEKIVEQENKLKNQQEQGNFDDPFRSQFNDYNSENPNVTGKWYFYNPQAISLGHSEFLKKWGQRQLEDDWRRKNKAIVLNMANSEEGDKSKNKATTEDRKKREFYLKNIPTTDSMRTASNDKISTALFKIGEIYDKKMKDYEEAIKTYEELNKRFPENNLFLESSYELYQLCLKLERTSRADYYKNLIVTKFPNSQYARLLSDPNYLKEMLANQKKISDFYDLTYNAYKNKEYESVLKNVDQQQKEFPTTDLAPKFQFVKSISLGGMGRSDEMYEQLKDLVKNYPSNEITSSANEIISVIESGKLKMDIYNISAGQKHSYVLTFDKSTADINQLKFNLTAFNVDFSNKIDFQIIDEPFDKNNTIIIVKGLSNKDEAAKYFKSLTDKALYKEWNEKSYRHFIISEDNLAIFKKDRIIDKYMTFFKDNYLK